MFVDGKLTAIQYRNDKQSPPRIPVPAEGVDLAVLVENMGRTNYGQNLIDRKGIDGSIRLGQSFVYHWEAITLPLDNVDQVKFGPMQDFSGRPQLLRGTFSIDGEPADTFVRMDDFKKGVIFVNGINLSRYWEVGPQKTAYLPAPFLKKGENELIILELDGRASDTVLLTDTPDLG